MSTARWQRLPRTPTSASSCCKASRAFSLAALRGGWPHQATGRDGRKHGACPHPLPTREKGDRRSLVADAPDQFGAEESEIFRIELFDIARQAVGELCGLRRETAGIDHHPRIGQFGETLQFLGLVPDDVEIGD